MAAVGVTVSWSHSEVSEAVAQARPAWSEAVYHLPQFLNRRNEKGPTGKKRYVATTTARVTWRCWSCHPRTQPGTDISSVQGPRDSPNS